MACRHSSAIFVAFLAILVVSAVAVTKDDMMGWMFMPPGAAPMPWMDMGPAPTPDVSGSVISSFPSMVAVIVASMASALLI